MECLACGINELNTLIATSKAGIDFDKLCDFIKNVLQVNVALVNLKGNLLKCSFTDDIICANFLTINDKDICVKENCAKDILMCSEIICNIANDEWGCVFSNKFCLLNNRLITLVPIFAASKQEGLMIIVSAREIDADESVFLQTVASFMGVAFYDLNEKQEEINVRKKIAVQMAIDSLSFSEKDAIYHIFSELKGKEGLLVASKVADSVGITRSVIVNALRKFESAGIIQSRSLGMKGTYIKVLNDFIFEAIFA